MVALRMSTKWEDRKIHWSKVSRLRGLGLIRFGGRVEYADLVSSSFVEESLQGLVGVRISIRRSRVAAGEHPFDQPVVRNSCMVRPLSGGPPHAGQSRSVNHCLFGWVRGCGGLHRPLWAWLKKIPRSPSRCATAAMPA